MVGSVTAAGDHVNNLYLPGPDGTVSVDACHLDFGGLTDNSSLSSGVRYSLSTNAVAGLRWLA